MNRYVVVLACAAALPFAALAKSKAVTQRPRDGTPMPLPSSTNTALPTPALVRPPSSTQQTASVESPTGRVRTKQERRSDYTAIRILDFESREERNDFDGGYFGIWTRDPDDITQGCTMKFAEPGAQGSATCLQLDYDVDAFHDAYNGFWLLFVDIDLTPYSNVCFWVKGSKSAGFSTQFVLELKNEDEAAQTIVDGVTDQWQLKRLPLSEFYGIRSWSKMTEFVVVFKDTIVNKETGKIYIDNIYFDAGNPISTVDMADTRLTDDEATKAKSTAGETRQVRPGAPPPKPLFEKTGTAK
ncbi:MAG TPA: hypothetical protein VIH35_05765 [Kiritimatiellia bacterium]